MNTPDRYPRLEAMASGAMALVLGNCGPADFDAVAAHWIRVLQLTILEEARSPDVRMFRVRMDGGEFHLAADRWLEQIALEPVSPAFTPIVERLYHRLTCP